MSSQGYTLKISLFTIWLFFIFIQIVLATNTITYFVNSTTTTEYNSSLATLNSVVYNTTINATQLSGTTLTGNITSQVYDLGSQVQFGNVTWTEGAPYGQALPSSGVESVLGGANMTNIIGLWHFDNLTGDVGASVTMVNSAYLNGSVSKLGNGSLAAMSGYANVSSGNYDLNEGGWTLSIWVKKNEATASGEHAVARNDNNNWNSVDGWRLTFPSNAAITFKIGNGGTYTYTYANNPFEESNFVWHHVVVTYQSKNITFYIDGQIDKSALLSNNATAGTKNLQIGSGSSAGSYYFNGFVDELAIWNRTLSSQEINNIYQRGAASLNITVRSCDDSACSGETYAQTFDTPGTNSLFSLLDNRYFQYVAVFSRINSSSVPLFYNLTIQYQTSDEIPTHSTPILNSTGSNNDYNQNLTVYNQSTADANNDPIKNIIDWRRNNESIAILNIPFEGLREVNKTFVANYAKNSINGSVNNVTYGATLGFDGFGAYNFSTPTFALNFSTTLNSINKTVSLWAKPSVSGANMLTSALVSSNNIYMFIDNQTTNLVTNPSFETGTHHWTNNNLGLPCMMNSGATVVRNATSSPFGNYSLSVNGSGFAYGVIYPLNISATAGENLTVSLYIKTDNAARVSLVDTTGVCSGVAAFNVPATSEWTRINITGAPTANRTVVYVVIINTNGGASKFHLDGLQVERTSMPTSYADGSLGQGYAWSGTAHSTSSTRQDNLLIFGTTYYRVSYNITSWAAGTWQHVAGTLNVSGIYLYNNGALVASNTTIRPQVTNSSLFQVGYDSSNSLTSLNGIIDDVMLYNESLPPSQIHLLYTNKTHIISSNLITMGENWTAYITPNDQIRNGQTLASNTLTVQNVSIDDVSINTTLITPSTPYQGQTLTINTTVYNLANVNTSNVNISLYIDAVLINSTLISTLQTLGSQNISFQWNATPSNRTILFMVDSANTISESNESNNNITTSVFVNKLVQLNLTTLTNGTEIVKGGGSTYEDPGSFVDDLTFVNVTLYNPYNSSELVNGTCAFSMNSTLLGLNFTDTTGNCMYSFNQTTLNTLNHTLFVNFSNLSTGFVTDSSNINATRTFVIAKYETENQEHNTRGAGYYSNGDAAVFDVNITKNDILYDPANLTIYVRRSSPNTLLHAYTYPTGITRSSTGVYQLIHIVNSSFGNAGIHWDVYASDNQTINSVKQSTLIPITSGSHSDVDIQPETATLNFGINNASGTTLNNTNVSIYDSGAYYLQGNNLTLTNTLLSRPGTQNSTYDINYITPVGALLSIRSLNVTTSNLTLTPQIVQNYTGGLPAGATSISSVIAVNASTFNFTNATLAIPLGGFTNITTIYRCTTWDHSSANCTSWASTPTSSYADFTLNATHFTFTVTSFSAYAGGNGSNENLTISSNGPILVNRNATFNATYYNTTSHALISGANCNISFNDTNTNTTMTEYADRYEALRSFNSSGIYLYTITCMKSGFSGLSTTDNITINPLTYPGITSITTNNSLPKKNAIVFLNWTITDNENLSSTWIQIRNSSGVANSTPQITTGTSNVGNYTYTVSDPKSTNLTFMVFVNDTDNTLNMSSSLSSIVQNTVPGIPSLNAPDNKTNYSIGIVVLNWSNVTDADGDSINYILEISNNSAFTSFEFSNTSVPETSNVTGITTTTLPNGTHYWRVLAKDTVGNSSYSSIRTFNTTTIPHSITINTPAINHTSNKLQITINMSTGRYTTLWYSLTNGSSNTTLCTNCLNGAATANLTRYGLHTLTAYANDSENTLITTSRNFTLYPDSDNNGTADSNADLGDDDGDGIVNINDTLKGNLTNLNTNIVSSVMVNGSSNLSQQFSGVLAVNLTNASTPVLLFMYNFSANQTLLLGNLSIMKQNTTETRGSILVTGLNLTSESTKTLYIDNIDTNKNGICIKDIIVTSIDDVSDDCTGSNETKLPCSAGGTTTGNYTCTSTDTWYVVTGATHTAAKETSITSSGSSGSSGGGRRTSSRGITNGLSVLYPKQVNYSQPFSVTAENIGYFDLSNITLSIDSLPSELNATITPQKFIILPRATSANFTVLITTLEKPLVDNFTIPFMVTSSSYTTKGKFFISKPTIVVLTTPQEETPPEVLDTPHQEEIPFTLPTMPKAQERYLGMFIIGMLAIVLIVDLISHFRAKRKK